MRSRCGEYRKRGYMKKGFTLAEVLITLLIIGVVAALTIPSVISNYQQQEFKTGLKKAVSVLNEAIQTNIAQEGETPYENSNLFTYLQRHMSILKSEYSSRRYNSNSVFYTTDGMRFELTPDYLNRWTPESNLKLHETGIDVNGARVNGYYEGSAVNSWNHQGSSRFCGSYGLGNNPNKTLYPPCIILVDINGDKKPTPFGGEYYSNGEIISYDTYLYPLPSDKKLNDIFNILITEEKAIPFGVVAQRAMYSK